MNYVLTRHTRQSYRDPFARVVPPSRDSIYHWWQIAREFERIQPRNARHAADRARYENELMELDAMEGGNV